MENLENEEWRDVPGYEGLYQVSNLGRVKSLPKSGSGGHNGKLLRMNCVGKIGKSYLAVILSKNKKTKSFKVHKLVAMAFLNHKPDGTHKLCVDHRDNDKLNNKLENLQLITARENTTKDKKEGTSKYLGVSWKKNANKWKAQIEINRKVIHLGQFLKEEDASKVYQLALKNIDLFDGDVKKFREYIKNIFFIQK
jgi:hypothetical protein